MTDEQATPEGFPGPIQPWIARLRRITEELAGMTELSESLFTQPLPALQGLPLPGALSAAQLNAIASNVAAAKQHRRAASSADRVRPGACGAAADPRPARRVEQDMGRV
jgi:hypothetical protein